MSNKLIKSFDDKIFTAEAWGRDGLRIRIRCNDQTQTSDWALDIPVASNAEVIEDEKTSVIINGKIKLELTSIWGHPIMMNFYRKSGNSWVSILREKEYPVIAH